MSGARDRDARRLFVGVPVAVTVAGELAATCESLARRARSREVALRWVAPAAYHVTLKFLGWVRPEAVDAVGAAVERATAGVAPFSFGSRQLGAFASPVRATVVWAGIDDRTATLERLAAALERELVPLGFAAEKRPFHPHVTLARLRAPTDVSDVLLPFAEQVFSETRVEFVTLFESVMKSSGSIYETVVRAPLEGPDRGAERQSEPVQPGPFDASSGTDDGWDRNPHG